jgi:hypothetical protein
MGRAPADAFGHLITDGSCPSNGYGEEQSKQGDYS